jgi:hypothetical protein
VILHHDTFVYHAGISGDGMTPASWPFKHRAGASSDILEPPRPAAQVMYQGVFRVSGSDNASAMMRRYFKVSASTRTSLIVKRSERYGL